MKLFLSFVILLFSFVGSSQELDTLIVYFESGYSVPSHSEINKVKDFDQKFLKCDRCYYDVYGFADTVGKVESNKLLSEKRSLSIKNLLNASFQIDIVSSGEQHHIKGDLASQRIVMIVANAKPKGHRVTFLGPDGQRLEGVNVQSAKEGGRLDFKTVNRRIYFKEIEELELFIDKDGYIFKSLEIHGNRLTDTVIQLELIKEGVASPVGGLNFVGNMPILLEKSYPNLKLLIDWAKTNSNLVIEIGGHVNGPGNVTREDKRRFKALSIARAQTVNDSLVNHGIDTARLVVKGYGRKEMIYPDPKDKGQHAANRRVEIKILRILEE